MAERRTDEDIKRDVIESLYWDDRVDAADVGVTVKDGHVTLTGSVLTFRERRAAREDTEIIRGVSSIDNRVEIVVSPELDRPGDADLLEAAQDVLAADPDLLAGDVDLAVSEGRIQLTGSVASFHEKELASSVLAILPGVRGVRNELTVVPTHDHEDAHIADDLLAALRRNRHVDVAELDIAVDRGEVTLAGRAVDRRTHDHIVDTVRRTTGVTGLTDHLRVLDGD